MAQTTKLTKRKKPAQKKQRRFKAGELRVNDVVYVLNDSHRRRGELVFFDGKVVNANNSHTFGVIFGGVRRNFNYSYGECTTDSDLILFKTKEDMKLYLEKCSLLSEIKEESWDKFLELTLPQLQEVWQLINKYASIRQNSKYQ